MPGAFMQVPLERSGTATINSIMSTIAVPHVRSTVVYPESDGKPIAENTLQFKWIVRITGGLEHLFAADPAVFVAGDLFWYPVEGRPDIRLAPDTMVVFGRPK